MGLNGFGWGCIGFTAGMKKKENKMEKKKKEKNKKKKKKETKKIFKHIYQPKATK